METIRWIAKALTAGGGAFFAAVAAYKLNVPPAVLVTVATVLGAVAVFLVPNGDKPTDD